MISKNSGFNNFNFAGNINPTAAQMRMSNSLYSAARPQNNNLPTLSPNLNNSIITSTFGICKYDSNLITEVNKSKFPNICSNHECIKEYNFKCKNIFKCGHECLLINFDKCEECLYSNCNLYINIFDQTNLTQCPICLDSLQTYPNIKLNCNHFIHRRCLEKKLQLKWNTKNISFNYLKCPICNTLIEECTGNKEITYLIKEGNKLYKEINEIADNKFIEEKYEGDFDLNKFSFYLCDKCGKPFCGGLRECREIEENEIDDDNKNQNKKICLDCYDYTKIKGVNNCLIHGRKNIQFKCKFCCNVSSHFCFGTTHFCEDCHITQLKGEYLTQKNIEELPKCEGKEKCLLKVDHPPNGEEFGICCLLCI